MYLSDSGIGLDSLPVGQVFSGQEQGDDIHVDRDSLTGIYTEMYNPRRKSSRSSDGESLELTVRKFFDTESNRNFVLQSNNSRKEVGGNIISVHSNIPSVQCAEQETAINEKSGALPAFQPADSFRSFIQPAKSGSNFLCSSTVTQTPPSQVGSDDDFRHVYFKLRPSPPRDAMASSSSEFDSDADLMQSQDAIFTGSTHFVNKKSGSRLKEKSGAAVADDYDSDISRDEQHMHVNGVPLKLLSRSAACYDIAALAVDNESTIKDVNTHLVTEPVHSGLDTDVNNSRSLEVNGHVPQGQSSVYNQHLDLTSDNKNIDIDPENTVSREKEMPEIALSVPLKTVEIATGFRGILAGSSLNKTVPSMKTNPAIQLVGDVRHGPEVVPPSAIVIQIPSAPLKSTQVLGGETRNGFRYPPLSSLAPSAGGSSPLKPAVRSTAIRMETELSVEEEETLRCFDAALFEFDS